MTVAANPNNSLSAVVTIASPEVVTIELTATSGDHVVTVPRTAVGATTTRIPLVGMRKERDYDLVATLFDAGGDPLDTVGGTFATGTIPERFAPYEFTADVDRASPGYTILEMQEWGDPSLIVPQRPFDDPQYLIALDDEGEIVWYYENGPVIGAVEQTIEGNFTSITFPNGVREFDILGDDVAAWEVPIENADGAEVALDDSRLLDDQAGGVTPPLPVDSDDVLLELIHHEGHQMSNGNYLALSTTSHPLSPEQQTTFCPDDTVEFGVFSDVAVEFEPNGRVVRTWDLWDAVDVDLVPGEEMCNEAFAVHGDRDWTHANAVVYDEARDAVVFSARHTSQVIAMKRLAVEGPQTKVLWIFGEGGTMPIEGDVPRYQHAVEIQQDGSILLYDNGNGRDGTDLQDPTNPPYSRAVQVAIDDTSADPDDWSVTQVWEHTTDDYDAAPLFAPFIGDADRLTNGNVLITHGGIDFMNPESFLHAMVIEVVPTGEDDGDVVWEFLSGSPDRLVSIYRAERIESFYVGPDWTAAG